MIEACSPTVAHSSPWLTRDPVCGTAPPVAADHPFHCAIADDKNPPGARCQKQCEHCFVISFAADIERIASELLELSRT